MSRDKRHLLSRGIRFASLEDFANFVGKNDIETNNIDKGNVSSTPSFDVAKLRSFLQKSNKSSSSMPSSSSKSSKLSSASQRLMSSRFRFLSERLYTQPSSQSLSMFARDPQAFEAYHSGFREQTRKWPIDPLKIIAQSVEDREGVVVADFGCGEARLSRELLTKCRVHSFDLIALNDAVTACDMAHTSLQDECVDVAVFCLALMGTNIKDYVKEANRVLKMGGLLKVAEVQSRFKDLGIEGFVEAMEKSGFKLVQKEMRDNGYFVFFDFLKSDKTKKKAPQIKLTPCLYKKR